MSANRFLGYFLLLTVLVTARGASGGLITSFVYVDSAGACAGNTPCFTTIQAGVNNAADSSVVVVYPGTYPESVNLSLMGSALGGSPGDLFIVNVGVIDVLPTAPAIEPPALEPSPLSARLLAAGQVATDGLLGLHQRLAALGASVLAPAVPNAAMLGEVLVNPAAGPAFYHSVDPFPGDVNIGGMTLLSLDDDGARLNVKGSIGILEIIANGNARNGLNLSATDAMSFFASTADNNGLGGIVAALDEEVIAINVSASGNKMGHGIQIRAGGAVTIASAEPEQLEALFPGADVFPTTTTNGNAEDGMNLQSAEDVGLGTVLFVGGDPQRIISMENEGAGIDIESGGTATVFRTRANLNFVGIDVDADATIAFLDSEASGNGTRGFVGDTATDDDLGFVALRVTAVGQSAGDSG